MGVARWHSIEGSKNEYFKGRKYFVCSENLKYGTKYNKFQSKIVLFLFIISTSRGHC